MMTLNPNVDEQHADPAEHTHLFNRNNGLRGFMARSWLTNNIALQGGLAINGEYLRERDGGLQHNMAIGMGVLLAF